MRQPKAFQRRPSRSAADPCAGRNVVITGGSSDIGRASAEAAVRKGAVVILLTRGEDPLDEVVQHIRDAGGRAHGYVCDVTDSDSVVRTVSANLSEHGRVDMFVDSAGRSIRRSTDRVHDYERTNTINYFGAIRLIPALVPHMRERRFGRVVNISKMTVLGLPARFSAYGASKSALDGFTDVVAAKTQENIG
ncbi:SDR family NAD(P)-dependent oxidoreductase [Rhodococcus fascians]|nr:SDR family NAD(P)-dependent oxidoreductase [Rhodococcus fascians]MBY4431967.1 SDR family NAD(P)-dependent oxidoreductase [Rhodococcus fascians]